MFSNLRDEIIKLNSDVKTVAGCERAKNLRGKLLKIGIPLAAGGFLGAFVCFILFATAGFDAFGENGPTARLLVPFILFLPCGAVGAIGSTIAGLGLKIVVTDYASNLVDETVGNHCPSCGEGVEGDQVFCAKCGTKLKKTCPDCQYDNGGEDEYCRKCGKKL